MENYLKRNVDNVMFQMKCTKEDAHLYLDYDGHIHYDIMGNVKEYLPKVLDKIEQNKKQNKNICICKCKCYHS